MRWAAAIPFALLAQSALAQGSPQAPNLFWSTGPAGGYLGLNSYTLAPQSSNWVDGHNYMACDGATDDTVGFQNAVNAAANGSLFLPKGLCLISATVNITSQMILHGAGSGLGETTAATTLRWMGASSTTPMINVKGVSRLIAEDFLIQSRDTHPLGIGIQSTTISGLVSTSNTYRRLFMNGTTNSLGKGFAFVTGSGGDNNNDQNFFESISIENYTIAGWSFEHSQSQGHRLIACNFVGDGATSLYGVTTALGAGTQGGSFVWFGGSGSLVTEADFYMGSPNSTILISNGIFESSSRLLETPGNGSNWPITIENVRFSSNTLNADGRAILYGATGPLTLIGNAIGDDNTKPLEMRLTLGAGNPTAAIAIGNHIESSLANPFSGLPWSGIGNNVNPTPGSSPNTISNQPAVTIANLPSCTAATVGQRANISNGQTSPTWNGAVSTTGAVYAPVGCSQTGSSSYGWVYQ